MICKKCDSSIPEESLFCNKCGELIIESQSETELEEMRVDDKCEISDNKLGIADRDKTKKLTFKNILLISIIFVIAIIVGVFIWQSSATSQVKSLYASKQYYEASNKADHIFIVLDKEIPTIKNKLLPLRISDQNLEFAKEWRLRAGDFAQDYYKTLLVETIASCIGWSEFAKERDCEIELDSIRQEAISMLVKEGFTGEAIKNSLLAVMEKSDYNFYPLLSDDKNKVDDLINQIPKSVSLADVEQVRNEKFPLRLEQTSLSSEGDYSYYSGTIKNYGNKTYSFVKVRAVYMDGEKSVLTSDWTYAVGS